MRANIRCETALIFVAVFFLLATAQTADADRLISAKNSRTTQTAIGIERIYTDSVRAAFGAIRVSADSAVVRTDGDDYLFLWGVRLRDEERRIRADALTYAADDSTAHFRGNVRIEDAGRSVFAERIDYDLARQVLTATSGVRLLLRDLRLTAERWFHDAKVDTGRLERTVEVRHGSGPDPIYLRANRARLSTRADTVDFAGACLLTVGAYSATGDSLTYAADRGSARLAGSARVEWSTEGNATDTHVEGREILISLDGGRPTGLTVDGRASIHSSRTASDSTRHFQLQSVRAEMDFADDQMAMIRAEDDCEMMFLGGSGDSTSMRAKRADLAFEVGQLTRIDLTIGVVSHHAKKRAHQVEGEYVTLLFEREHIRSVQADSSATFRDLDGATHIVSDRLELTFENGDLASARAVGGVSGEVEEAP